MGVVLVIKPGRFRPDVPALQRHLDGRLHPSKMPQVSETPPLLSQLVFSVREALIVTQSRGSDTLELAASSHVFWSK